MQIRLYLDEDAMDNDLVRALRLHGIDVITALDLGLISSTDLEHLQCAMESDRVLYSFNVSDFMNLHTHFPAAGKNHAGIIFGDQQRYSVGEQMRRIVRLVQMRSAESMRNTVEFLSAWG
jgi:predicted nuclease of predicted toxin-antitoxin system